LFIQNLKEGQHIHMIGIGGISMSGLAEILVKWGYKVSGSDLKPSEITEKLEKSGIIISIPHVAQPQSRMTIQNLYTLKNLIYLLLIELLF